MASIAIVKESADVAEESFESFVRRYQSKAVQIVWRVLQCDASTAEDIAQDAFIKAHKGRLGFRNDAKMDTWFYRILMRQVSNYRRSEAIRAKYLFWKKMEPASGQWVRDPYLRDRLTLLVSALSPQQKEVFVLTQVEEFSMSETAEILNLAPGTVKTHLHRARNALRVALEKDNDNE